MAGLRIVLGSSRSGQIGQRVKRSMRANADAVRSAMRDTAADAAERIMEEGRADIKSAGNFGSRWTDGWQARVSEGGGNIRVTVTMAVAYWTVFQDGKVIQGKPLLWIPLSFATDAQGISARDYPGQLFRVNRKSGAPLLMAGNGRTAEPKYFGKEQVTIPKKFRLREIIARVVRDLARTYRAHFKKARANG